MDREWPIPSYVKVAETIRGRIRQGLYGVGELIPNTQDLELEFQVSNITIRKALQLLVADGLIVRRRGVGTRVAEPKDPKTTIEITSDLRAWFASHIGPEGEVEAQVLELGLYSCPVEIRETLGLAEGRPVWRMKRLRRLKGQPLSYLINYARPEDCTGITKAKAGRASFIDVFMKISGIKLAKIEQEVDLAVADLDLSKLLRVAFGTPVFFVKYTYFDTSGQPVEVTHMYGRGDRFAYKASIRV